MTNRREDIISNGYLGHKDMKFVSKSWGYELWIVNSEKYCGKILFIKKGHHCSFHEHKIKDEVLYVRTGACKFRIHDPALHLEKEEDEFILNEGDAWHVRPGMIHQMTALTDTEIIEISTQHFDSDSYRQKE